ncbi:MAG TPA: hypothetical protein VGI39_40090, partial [Polyangiaceae bacterium]
MIATTALSTGLAMAPRTPLEWGSALLSLVTLAMTVRLAIRALSRSVPYTRLLLPGILLVEGLAPLLHVRARGALVAGTMAAFELGVLAFAAWEFRRAARSARVSTPEERLGGILEAFLPPLMARVAACELVLAGASLRFVFGGLRQAPPPGHSYHVNATLRALLPVLPMLLGVDTMAVHAMIPASMVWLQVVHVVVVVYSAVWVIGMYALLRGRPHVVERGALRFHGPFFASVTVDPALVRGVAVVEEPRREGAHRLVVAGTPVVEIRLERAVAGRGVMGSAREGDRILVSADDPGAL